jgi:hypothetical protein
MDSMLSPDCYYYFGMTTSFSFTKDQESDTDPRSMQHQQQQMKMVPTMTLNGLFLAAAYQNTMLYPPHPLLFVRILHQGIIDLSFFQQFNGSMMTFKGRIIGGYPELQQR